MKFSVLLPTRNRLEYLRYAIETVLRQDYDDWEIVVSDNCSEEDVAGYVESLHEPRIKYVRTAVFVPVTDNWNNALEHCSGDYVIMLGDDDCLMQSFFTTVDRIIEQWKQPDCIYTNAFMYAYPGVMPGFPDGYFQRDRNLLFQKSAEPRLLAQEEAHKLVQNSLNFRMKFAYNMQFSVISRRLVDALRAKGSFFQSPYPDFYATNVIFLNAQSIVICPHPLVTIGITPKSYGFFHFNKQEQQGAELLKNAPSAESAAQLQRVLLPGSNNNTSWLFAMETIKVNYGKEFLLRVNYQRYRLLQILHVYKNYYLDQHLSMTELHELQRNMRVWEKLLYGSFLRATFALLGTVQPAQREKLITRLRLLFGQYAVLTDNRPDYQFSNILEVFEQVNPAHG